MEMFHGRDGAPSAGDPHGFFSPAGRALGRLVGPRVKWVVVLLAVVGSGVVLAFGGAAEAASTTATSHPDSAESARVSALRATLPDSGTAPALAVFTRDGDGLTDADRAAVTAAQRRVVEQDPQRGGPPAQVADDGAAALPVVPLPSGLSDEEVATTVDQL